MEHTATEGVSEVIFIWPTSSQLMRERRKKKRLSCVHKEVVAWKHFQRKRDARLILPAFKIVPGHSAIVQAAKGGDGTVKAKIRLVDA